MKITSKGILKLYIFTVLYASVLRLIAGRWATVVADIFTIILLVFVIYNQGRWSIKVDRHIKVIFILVTVIELTALFEMFNPNIKNFLYSLIEYRKSYFQLITFPIIYWLVKKKFHVQELMSMLKYIAYLSLPIVLYGIKQYFFWGAIDSKLLAMMDSGTYTMLYAGHIRSSSIFSGPFHYGMFCAIIATLFLYLWQNEHKKSDFFSVILCVIGCFCSITRTNIICMMFVLLLWYMMYLRLGKGRNFILEKAVSVFLVIAALMLVSYSFLGNSGYNNAFSTALRSLRFIQGDSRFNGRLYTWLTAIHYIVQKPILGYGIGSAGDTLAAHSIASVSVTTHNMILKMFMELGVPVGVMYCALFIIPAFSIRQISDYKLRTVYYCLTSIIFINGLTGATISEFPCLTLYWIIIGILMANIDNDALPVA